MAALRLVIFCSVFLAVKSCGDFYWREYNGTVPSDAFPVRKGAPVYIGRALYKTSLLPTSIIEGEPGVVVATYYDAAEVYSRIEILCAADHRKFYWLEADSENYLNQTAGLCPVLGGYDPPAVEFYNVKEAPAHIGRVPFDYDHYRAGNLIAYPNQYGNLLYCAYNGFLTAVSNYEVLIYKDV